MATRHETLFNLRYAVVVLERHAALYRKLDGALRFLSLMSGSAALLALTSSSTAAVVAGLVFACAQAVEHTLRPGDTANRSLLSRKAYASVLAGAAALNDDALHAAYLRAAAEDEVHIGLPLRKLAYNDVLTEMGLDETSAYPRSPTMAAFALLT